MSDTDTSNFDSIYTDLLIDLNPKHSPVTLEKIKQHQKDFDELKEI